MTSSPREENRVPGLVAKSDADNSVVILEADPVTKRLKVNTTITGGKLVTSAFDYIAATYPDSVTEIYTYKTGGSGGSTVATITVIYQDGTKALITSVTRT